jgi:hypothetical protein
MKRYRKAAEGGETLAMANIAHKLIPAGFHDEAQVEIDKGRRADKPHASIGSAMVALSQAAEDEAKRWADERRIALGQRSFFDDLADAMVSSEPESEAIIGPWQAHGAATLKLDVIGTAAQAAWEEGTEKRRFRGAFTGKALIGTLDEWRTYPDRFETVGILSLVLRTDGSLSGILVNNDGKLKAIEWKKDRPKPSLATSE